MHTWHVFILITAVVPLLGGLFHLFLPESPKFHMSHGQNIDAIRTLQKVYAINNKKEKSEYPVSII